MKAAAALACALLCTTVAAAARPRTQRVARVVDGDTLVLAGGQRVRLVQIDAPELAGGECYSRAAARTTARLLPPGTRVELEADPQLDRVDRYGRLLRYVWARGRDVNLALVRAGAATVWFYNGERGKHAGQLLAAARAARAARRGLWGVCRRAVWNVRAPATTGTSGPPADSRPPASSRCDPSYPTVCIPPPPPDLDCADVRYRSFRVLQPDPHHFDGNHDGIACER